MILKWILKKFVGTVKTVKNMKDFTLSNLNSKKKVFQTYNKHIKYQDIRDPKFNERNRNFEIRPIRDSNLECKIINSLTMISRRALELFLH